VDNFKTVPVPTSISIWAGNAGEIVLGTGEVGAPQRVVTNLTYSGSFFGGGTASITLWEPVAADTFPKYGGGVWRIKVNNVDCFCGFLDTSTAQRIGGGYMRTFNLVDLLTAWDLTLNDILPHGATTEAPIADTLSTVLNYMIDTVEPMSGISFSGTVPTTTITVDEQYSDKVLVISNSTYLAEIQKLALVLGVTLYQNPSQNTITCANALTPGFPAIDSMESERFKEASFDVNYSTIPATVMVLDDVTHVADAYGKYGGDGTLTNFTMTGRNNLAYMSCIGMDDTKLGAMAQNVYDVSRHASQVLTFTYAGLEPDKTMLGKSFAWTDVLGQGADNLGYTVSGFTVNLTATSVYTTIEAYKAT
jgi:hypothetical protein